MMPRSRLAHIWLIGGVADDRIWLRRGAAFPAALTDGFKGAFTVSGVLCAAGAALTFLLLPRKRAAENERAAHLVPGELGGGRGAQAGEEL